MYRKDQMPRCDSVFIGNTGVLAVLARIGLANKEKSHPDWDDFFMVREAGLEPARPQ